MQKVLFPEKRVRRTAVLGLYLINLSFIEIPCITITWRSGFDRFKQIISNYKSRITIRVRVAFYILANSLKSIKVTFWNKGAT